MIGRAAPAALALSVAACAGAGPWSAAPRASESAQAQPIAGRIFLGVAVDERAAPVPAPPESEPPGRVPPVDAAMEDAMVAKVNAYRAAHGLAPLAVRLVLVDKARLWAQTMASGACGVDGAGAPKICHSSLRDGVTVPYRLLAENVGKVAPPDVSLLQTAFERSPSHSAEMLNPAFSFIGIGVAYSGETMFVSEEFLASPPP